MPEPDRNPPDHEEERPATTREAEVEPGGEVEIPSREEVPDVEPRRIHPRRPLPPVPRKEDR
ncbi:MAG: hypothetical protein KGN36_21725 [Acidobacteriota bacterium]|nr:hypothetical protein [Acidobacteriota bacterium]